MALSLDERDEFGSDPWVLQPHQPCTATLLHWHFGVNWIIDTERTTSITYDHRLKRTGYPVRSGILNLEIG